MSIQPLIREDDPAVLFEHFYRRIDADLENAVSTEFPPNLYHPMKYALSAKGKRLRPVLLLFACDAVGGDIEQAYKAALAIEILHTFTLIHDDIMDNDDLRRGRETVHKKWNSTIAILAGDGLIALAYRYLLSAKTRRVKRIVRIFSEAIIVICEGQSLDKDMETTASVSINGYLDMIRRKTGVLMAISAELGGIFGGGNRETVGALHSFGLNLGIAFQIQDDMLDLITEEKTLGKDRGSDLLNGKKTYPLILLSERASKRDAAYLVSVSGNGTNDPVALRKVIGMMQDYGVVGETRREIDRRIACALAYIQNLRAENLTYLCNLIRNRTF